MNFKTGWIDAILMNDGGAGGAGADGGQQQSGQQQGGQQQGGQQQGGQQQGGQQQGGQQQGGQQQGGQQQGGHDQAAADAAIAAAAQAAAAAAIYKPEGLPDHMLGKDDRETIDKMASALKGYRDRDGQVPDKPEAYKSFDKVDEAIKPHVEQLAKDPLFDRLTEKARERGIPLATFQSLTTDLITLGVEMGIYEPPLDVAAERAALTPEAARHLPEAEQKAARERRMNDNFAWMDQLVAQNGQQGLSKDAVDFAKQMLGDRAVGHELIEYFRAQSQTGRGPLMEPGNPGGGDPKAAIRARQALPENTWGDPKFDRASYDKLQEDARKVFGS